MLPVYCLNLEKFTDRKEHIQNQADKLGLNIEWVQCFDGWKIPKAEKFTCCKAHPNRTPDYINMNLEYIQLLINNKFYLFNSNLTKGEIGLAITTLVLFQKLLAEPNPGWALIIEDDITFANDFMAEYSQLQKDLPLLERNGADFVYLNDSIQSHPDHSNLIIEDRYLPVKKGCGYYGYIVSPAGMRKLLDLFNPLIFPIDLQSISHLECYSAYPELRYREQNLIKPTIRLNGYKYHKNLVTHPNTFESTIHSFCPYHK